MTTNSPACLSARRLATVDAQNGVGIKRILCSLNSE